MHRYDDEAMEIVGREGYKYLKKSIAREVDGFVLRESAERYTEGRESS